MPNYDWTCSSCGHRFEEVVPIAERDTPRPCPMQLCSGRASRELSAPTVLRASYHDGFKRKGWAELREANKLVREKVVSKSETRKEIEREIKKLGVKLEG